MSKLKKFFKESRYPEFYPKVWKMGGVEWEQFKEYPNDYYAADTGNVHGCIYYVDTVKFAKKHHLQILNMIDDFEEETGSKLENKPRSTDDDQYWNWLTWFAWESMAGELISFLEE